MEYTILKLAHLAGISTRTLRYYDEIDLLKPARMSSSGYRIYSQKEVDQLQQILFYKELGVGLDEIKQIINNPQFDDMQALQDHYQKLLEKRKQIDTMIETVQLTIQSRKGEIKMTDKQKFEGLKKQLIEEAMETNNPESELAQVLAKKHHEWLGYTWPSYSKEAHAGLAQMYVADPRFTAYYDEKIKPGAAQFLCDAILVYTK